jgi:hypothetical protein
MCLRDVAHEPTWMCLRRSDTSDRRKHIPGDRTARREVYMTGSEISACVAPPHARGVDVSG